MENLSDIDTTGKDIAGLKRIAATTLVAIDMVHAEFHDAKDAQERELRSLRSAMKSLDSAVVYFAAAVPLLAFGLWLANARIGFLEEAVEELQKHARKAMS